MEGVTSSVSGGLNGGVNLAPKSRASSEESSEMAKMVGTGSSDAITASGLESVMEGPGDGAAKAMTTASEGLEETIVELTEAAATMNAVHVKGTNDQELEQHMRQKVIDSILEMKASLRSMMKSGMGGSGQVVQERKEESGFHTLGEESGLTMPAGKPDLQAVKPAATEKQTAKLHDSSAGSGQKEGKEGFSNSRSGDKWSDGLVEINQLG
jgi:hypothetical protein